MKRNYILPILLTLILASCGGRPKEEPIPTEKRFLASDRPIGYIYSFDEENSVMNKADSLYRGSEIQMIVGSTQKIDKVQWCEILPEKKVEGVRFFVEKRRLPEDSTAVVLEKTMYARSACSVISDTATSRICTLTDKASKVEICGYNKIDCKGNVDRYKVRVGDEIKEEGWIYAKYLVYDEAYAKCSFLTPRADSLHRAIKNRFGAGEAIGCDFYPNEKVSFKHNKMPDACYSLYLNFAPGVVGNIEEYIALAKETKINTFVIDIKDNECPGYKAEAMRIYSPTNYARASSRGEKLYERAVRRLHEEGFYVVGRITCFKDSYFVKDHPESAITELATGEPFKHNKSYWPSAYDRAVWQFNVELAKESIRRFGFDEINFDYVRFPDRMTKIEDQIDYHNKYDETKVQAIQRFVTYACDEIHALGAYVSIDVFGECANPGYTTAYGQYWPALSNVADAMCGMPYPDHFPDGFYGIKKPWNNPYELLAAWGKRVLARQEATPSPAKVRTWVQAYHVMKYVDPEGIDYNAENIEKEIRGLYSVGIMDGYTTWLSSSNIERYRSQAAAFSIDYLKEYTSNTECQQP